jgi:hypothetical protein
MTQIAALAPAARRLTEKLVSRLALALVLAYLVTVLPGVVKSTAVDGPLEGVHTLCTLTAWLIGGFWQALAG